MKLYTFFALASLTALPLSAATLQFNEVTDGELGEPSAPTVLSFDIGSNTVVGTTGGPGSGTDRDAFSFIIGAGQSLVSIFLDSYNTVGATTNNRGFYAIDEGSTTVIPSSTNSGELLTGRTFIFSELNPAGGQVDLLDTSNQTAGPGIAGGELGPGTYTFLIQNTNTVSDFGLSFNVVPEPSSALLLGLGMLGLARRRR